MSDLKTSQETAASALTGTELIRIVQGGSNAKATATQFQTFCGGQVSAGTGITVTGTNPSVVSITSPLVTSVFPALTGDITTPGGSLSTTLATVATAGTTGSSTAIPVITINAKGLTTSITTAAVIAPAGTLTGTTLAANVVNSSLTSVGTLTVLTIGTGQLLTAGRVTLNQYIPVYDLFGGTSLTTNFQILNDGFTTPSNKGGWFMNITNSTNTQVPITLGLNSQFIAIDGSIKALSGSDATSTLSFMFPFVENDGPGTAQVFGGQAVSATGSTGTVYGVNSLISARSTTGFGSAYRADNFFSNTDDVANIFSYSGSSGNRYSYGFAGTAATAFKNAAYDAWMATASASTANAYQIRNNAGSIIGFWDKSANLLAPQLTGGTGVGDRLNLQSTTGVGSSDSITFATGSQSIRMTILSGGNIGIGTEGNPQSNFTLSTNTTTGIAKISGAQTNLAIIGKDAQAAALELRSFGGVNYVAFGRALNTAASPSAITNNATLGALYFTGYDGSNYSFAANVQGTARQTFTAGANAGSSVDIYTTPLSNSGGGASLAGSFTSSGGLSVGSTYNDAGQGSVYATGVVITKGYTVATLPSTAATGKVQGAMAFVTDALAPSFLTTIAGGGTVVAPVFYNGTNWVGA